MYIGYHIRWNLRYPSASPSSRPRRWLLATSCRLDALMPLHAFRTPYTTSCLPDALSLTGNGYAVFWVGVGVGVGVKDDAEFRALL